MKVEGAVNIISCSICRTGPSTSRTLICTPSISHMSPGRTSISSEHVVFVDHLREPESLPSLSSSDAEEVLCLPASSGQIVDLDVPESRDQEAHACASDVMTPVCGS